MKLNHLGLDLVKPTLSAVSVVNYGNPTDDRNIMKDVQQINM